MQASAKEESPSLHQLAAQVQSQQQMLLQALSDLGRIMEAVNTMEDSISGLKASIEEVTTNIGEVNANIADVKADNGELKTMIGDINKVSAEQEIKREARQSSHMTKPKDCADLFKSGARRSGVYTIYPIETECSVNDPLDKVQVYCDMCSSGGGWTVFLRRVDDKWDFPARNWSDYARGF